MMEERLRKVYQERLDRYQSTLFYHNDNLWSRIVAKTHNLLSLEVYSGQEALKWHQVRDRPFVATQVGNLFGPTWSTHWFRVHIKDHKLHSVKNRLVIWWDCESEAMFYNQEGHPIGAVNEAGRHWIDLASLASNLFYVEMVGVGMGGNATGQIMIAPPNENRQFRLKRAEIVELREEALNLWFDLRILLELNKHNGDERALRCGNEICNHTLRPDLPDELKEGTQISKLFFAQTGTTQSVVTAIGNCHIDTAWLWPWSETRRKTARSWVSQLRLMEKYPDYRFVASQMQQLEWLRQDYPGLFKEIQQAAARGQFIPIGGSWVEMDGNIPSGESFVRQLLYGQRFQQTYFNQRSRIFWLPDTFGYHGQLPQLAKQAGMDYFMTTKMAWSNFNRFPHSTFHWQGIDGTQVLAHLPPANTYTSTNLVQDAVTCGKARTKHSMLLYGHGDGGGGPTEEMLYNLDRITDLKGMPQIVQRDPEAFFTDLSAEPDLPCWRGEMYLEAHQGTLTSQARTKYYNRKCEGLLMEAELACSLASLALGPSEYQADSLERLWKGVLLCQFHDILPGSSIERVYEDSDRVYVNVEYWASRIREVAMQHLFGSPVKLAEVTEDDIFNTDRQPLAQDSLRALKQDLQTEESVVSIEALDSIVFLNPTPFERGEVIVLPFSEDDPRSPQRGVIAVEGIPAWSMATFEHHSVEEVKAEAKVQGDPEHGYFMENGLIRAEFDKVGQLMRLYDKHQQREVCIPGQVGNQLMMYEDMPRYWDAWDVEWYCREKGWPVGSSHSDATVEIGRTGPLLVTLIRRVRLDEHGSELEQVISLTYLSSLLEFYTKVEWQAKHRMLRVNFPVAIHANRGLFECPFGIQERSLVKNTSWEQAQFEVCAHRWMSVSEGAEYSCALLNDCKYGHSMEQLGKNGVMMSISLLRSPKMPDAHCDMGEHVFRYALLPCAGADPITWIAEAHRFNTPLRWTAASPGRYDPRWLHHSFLSFEPAKSLIMSGIKRAEGRDNWFVLRAYEAAGVRGRVRLQCHPQLKIKDCLRVNLLEDPIGAASEYIDYAPFEIVSLLIQLEMLQ